MPQSNVKIAPALPSDYFAVAKIENLAFRAEPIDIICFGPNRDSEERIRKRVENLATPPPKKGERIEVYKVRAPFVSVGYCGRTNCGCSQ